MVITNYGFCNYFITSNVPTPGRQDYGEDNNLIIL